MLRYLKNILQVLLCATVMQGCAHYQFRIIVQDEDDQPISGALVYAESYNQRGAVDFTWVRAGDSITVPPEHEPAIRLGGTNETFVGIAVLAENKNPVIMRDPSGVLKPEMWEYMVEAQHHMGLNWEPKVGELRFPFVHEYELKERLKKKENWALVHAFHRVYAPLGVLINKGQASRLEIEKYHFFMEKVYAPVVALEAAATEKAAKMDAGKLAPAVEESPQTVE